MTEWLKGATIVVGRYRFSNRISPGKSEDIGSPDLNVEKDTSLTCSLCKLDERKVGRGFDSVPKGFAVGGIRFNGAYIKKRKRINAKFCFDVLK
jgi:hypothetical protein